jgi:hypothetical protein
MRPLKNVSVDHTLQHVTGEHTVTQTTRPDPSDDRNHAELVIHGILMTLLPQLNMASENEFTVVIHVQGSTESGRIIQAAVLDSMEGPLIAD